MAVHEGFQGLGNPEVVSGLEALGVKFEFKGFKAGVLQLNLESGQFDGLKKFLEIDREHQPKNVLVIFDEDKPRLAVVRGDREIWLQEDPSWYSTRENYYGDVPYLHVILTDPKDKEIFFQGDNYFSLVEFKLKKRIMAERVIADNCIKNDFRQSGTITITKDGDSLLIKGEQGEEITQKNKVVEVKI